MTPSPQEAHVRSTSTVGQVIQTFLLHGYVDEMTVSHAPVIIGSGIPLFGFLDHYVRLTPRASHASNGMVHATYDVDHDVADQ